MLPHSSTACEGYEGNIWMRDQRFTSTWTNTKHHVDHSSRETWREQTLGGEKFKRGRRRESRWREVES
jgi:hypothetical protein